MARASTASNDTSPKATGDVSADLEAQIAHLKSEMSRLAESVSNAGSVIAKDVKGNARVRGEQMRRSSEATIRDLRAQLDEIEETVSGHVRDRPLTAIAAAAGVGFLIALIARR